MFVPEKHDLQIPQGEPRAIILGMGPLSSRYLVSRDESHPKLFGRTVQEENLFKTTVSAQLKIMPVKGTIFFCYCLKSLCSGVVPHKTFSIFHTTNTSVN